MEEFFLKKERNKQTKKKNWMKEPLLKEKENERSKKWMKEFLLKERKKERKEERKKEKDEWKCFY